VQAPRRQKIDLMPFSSSRGDSSPSALKMKEASDELSSAPGTSITKYGYMPKSGCLFLSHSYCFPVVVSGEGFGMQCFGPMCLPFLN